MTALYNDLELCQDLVITKFCLKKSFIDLLGTRPIATNIGVDGSSTASVSPSSAIGNDWQTLDSTGSAKLTDIGIFNTHATALVDDYFYLYQVSGGLDYDAGGGYQLTTNTSTIRAFISGDEKRAGNGFIVSHAS